MDGQSFPFLLLSLVFTVAIGLDAYPETTVTPHNVSVFLEERTNETALLDYTEKINKNKTQYIEHYALIASYCWMIFTNQMANISEDHWCEWRSIVRPYLGLRNCLEDWADKLNYSYPNVLADHCTMEAHHMFFINCSLERPPLLDPPENILLTLIIAPICLIPFLVTLVVLKSKDGEMQS